MEWVNIVILREQIVSRFWNIGESDYASKHILKKKNLLKTVITNNNNKPSDMVEIVPEVPIGSCVHYRVKDEELKLTRRRHDGLRSVAAVTRHARRQYLCREPPAAAREEEGCVTDWEANVRYRWAPEAAMVTGKQAGDSQHCQLRLLPWRSWKTELLLGLFSGRNLAGPWRCSWGRREATGKREPSEQRGCFPAGWVAHGGCYRDVVLYTYVKFSLGG